MAERRPIVNPASLSEHVNTDTLNVGQGPVFAEQASSLGTPASGSGVVYAKTDGKLYFKNDSGTEYDLTASGGSGTNPVIREYTANDTWTKPTAANFWGIYVVCVGGGGGGGGGRLGANNSSRGGGNGGGGGAIAARLIRAATLTQSTYAVTIGAGGIGAIAQTAQNTNGNAGGAGGSTSFGTQPMVLARFGTGGPGGVGGNNAANAGGTADLCTPQRGLFSIDGGSGAASAVAGAAANGADGFTGLRGCPSGGAGKSINNTNTLQTTGGNGGGVYLGNTLVAGGVGSLAAGVNGGDGLNNQSRSMILDFDNNTNSRVGTAGGGGYPGNTTGTTNGTNGGAGGAAGAGGGGGGAATNPAIGGAGGNGGRGLCLVIEYYGA